MLLTGRAARVLLRAFAVCVASVTGLSLWNFAAAAWLHAHNPVPGAFYQVGLKQMHIYCTGTGSPPIVLEAASSAPWSQWRTVQPELSRVTRVCSYDRAGHGWSEPREGPRDAETIARELHSLLDQAVLQRPFIYAGLSAGGLYAREFSREFPSEIAGVVLIDASSPQQIDELPGFRASYEKDIRDAPLEHLKDRLRVWSGWDRLVGRCSVTPSRNLRGMEGQYSAMACRPGYVGTDESEFNDFETSCRQAGRLKSFGNVPLLVISADAEMRTTGMATREISQGRIWDREQEQSKYLSPLGWRVIARRSGHIVTNDRPDVVIEHLTRLIDYLRNKRSLTFGTTSTE